MLAFHRVLQTIHGESLHTLRSPARATALLRIIWIILMGIIRLHTRNNTIHHVCFNQAAPAAVMPACRRNPFPLRFCFIRGSLHSFQAVVHTTSQGCRATQRSAPFHEAASAEDIFSQSFGNKIFFTHKKTFQVLLIQSLENIEFE
jgi:hypothetical protein